MARAIHLASWFLTGCILFSCLGWLATIDSVLFTLVNVLMAVVMVSYALSWLLDDSIYRLLRVDELDYKASLIGFGASLLIGIFVAVLIARFQ